MMACLSRWLGLVTYPISMDLQYSDLSGLVYRASLGARDAQHHLALDFSTPVSYLFTQRDCPVFVKCYETSVQLDAMISRSIYSVADGSMLGRNILFLISQTPREDSMLVRDVAGAVGVGPESVLFSQKIIQVASSGPDGRFQLSELDREETEDVVQWFGSSEATVWRVLVELLGWTVRGDIDFRIGRGAVIPFQFCRQILPDLPALCQMRTNDWLWKDDPPIQLVVKLGIVEVTLSFSRFKFAEEGGTMLLGLTLLESLDALIFDYETGRVGIRRVPAAIAQRERLSLSMPISTLVPQFGEIEIDVKKQEISAERGSIFILENVEPRKSILIGSRPALCWTFWRIDGQDSEEHIEVFGPAIGVGMRNLLFNWSDSRLSWFFTPESGRYLKVQVSQRSSETEICGVVGVDLDQFEVPSVMPATGPAVGVECPVCLDQIAEGEAVQALHGCNHPMHPGCASQWINTQPSCPVCRSKVDLRTTTADPLETAVLLDCLVS